MTVTGLTASITGLQANTSYWIGVVARNSAGSSGFSGTLATQTLAATNTTVDANAGSDKTVASAGTVTIGGTDTVTNGVGSTTIAWTRVSGVGGSLSSTSVASPVFTAPTLSVGAANRTIVWRKTVTNNGVSDTDDVTITVTAPSNTPSNFSYTDSSIFKSSNGFVAIDSDATLPAAWFSDGTDRTIYVFVGSTSMTLLIDDVTTDVLKSSIKANMNISLSGTGVNGLSVAGPWTGSVSGTRYRYLKD